MIEVNKEMTWKDAVEKYPGSEVFAIVKEYECINNCIRPKVIFLKSVIEDARDHNVISRRLFVKKEKGEVRSVPFGYKKSGEPCFVEDQLQE